MTQVRAASADAEPFVVVLGSPRSGTTMLRLMLSCHPDMVVPPEAGFAVWLAGDFADAIGSDPRANVEAYADAVMRSRKFEHWRLGRAAVLAAVSDAADDGYAACVRSVYRAYAVSVGKPRAVLGDKNNFYITQPAEVDRVFPGCRVLHLVRDPRDVYCSRAEVSAAGDLGAYAPMFHPSAVAFAQQWSRENAEVVRTFEGQSRYLRLEYESLAGRPEETLRSVCHHIGVEYNRAMLDFGAENRRMGLEPHELLPWKRMTLDPLTTSRVGRYVDELSLELQEQIERECADWYASVPSWRPRAT